MFVRKFIKCQYQAYNWFFSPPFNNCHGIVYGHHNALFHKIIHVYGCNLSIVGAYCRNRQLHIFRRMILQQYFLKQYTWDTLKIFPLMRCGAGSNLIFFLYISIDKQYFSIFNFFNETIQYWYLTLFKHQIYTCIYIYTGELGYDGPLNDGFLHMTDDMLGPSPMHIMYSSYVCDGFCIWRTNFPCPIESVISKFNCIYVYI